LVLDTVGTGVKDKKRTIRRRQASRWKLDTATAPTNSSRSATSTNRFSPWRRRLGRIVVQLGSTRITPDLNKKAVGSL